MFVFFRPINRLIYYLHGWGFKLGSFSMNLKQNILETIIIIFRVYYFSTGRTRWRTINERFPTPFPDWKK